MLVRALAAILLAVEAAGVLVLLIVQLGAIVSGDVASLVSALALAVLTLVGAALIAGFAWATARGQSWGRSGGIVIQALIIAVAIGALTGDPPLWTAAAALAAPALVTAALLIAAARAAGRERREP